MGGVSLKIRVTVWYTALMAAIVFVLLVFLVVFSRRMMLENSQRLVNQAVQNAINDVSVSKDGIDTSDVSFYNGGASIFFYNSSGALIAPSSYGERGIEVSALLEPNIAKEVSFGGESWLVSDVYADFGGEKIWVRGVIQITDIYRMLQVMSIIALVCAPVFILLSALGGWFILLRGISPIETMVSTAEAINGGEDLSRRLHAPPGSPELDRLAAAFNNMLDRLQASFERARQFNSDVSHELRTPASIIIAQSEYSLLHAEDTQEMKESAEVILRQSRRMSSIISQLLMLARADSGTIRLEPERFDVAGLCAVIAEEAEEAAKENNISVKTDLNEKIIINADETMIMRMISNLVSNAVNYNKPGGLISISAKSADGRCIITVSDTGVGIPPSDIEKIWNRFYRVDKSRGGSGTGLGLSMVKWIAEAHGGRVCARSVYGKGSEFSVSLPIETKP